MKATPTGTDMINTHTTEAHESVVKQLQPLIRQAGFTTASFKGLDSVRPVTRALFGTLTRQVVLASEAHFKTLGGTSAFTAAETALVQHASRWGYRRAVVRPRQMWHKDVTSPDGVYRSILIFGRVSGGAELYVSLVTTLIAHEDLKP